jgi:fructuronate reductase
MEIDLGERYLEFLRNDVGFISTSVDRITPRTTQQDVELTLQSTGWEDSIPVVTEPFASWVLSGEFLSERPKWEDAGALFVEDIEVYENRKLWLLNGAHSYLAYRGINRGFETVSEAISDPEVYKEVVDLWSEATPHIPLEVSEYVNDLLARFQNERISHRLEQVAQDGLLKLQMRCSQVVLQNLSEGTLPHSYARLFAEWIAYVKSSDYKDSRRELIESASSVPDYLALIDLELSNSRALVELIESLLSKTKGVKC